MAQGAASGALNQLHDSAEQTTQVDHLAMLSPIQTVRSYVVPILKHESKGSRDVVTRRSSLESRWPVCHIGHAEVSSLVMSTPCPLQSRRSGKTYN
jgi:hypothetical protein